MTNVNQKPTLTPAEIEESLCLSQLILVLSSSAPPHIGLCAMIMAASVRAASLHMPLENFMAWVKDEAKHNLIQGEGDNR